MNQILETNDNVIETFLCLSIACLLATFTSKAYDVVFDYKKISEMKCDMINKNSFNHIDKNSNDNDNCYNKKNKLEEEYNSQKMVYMLTLGFMFLFIGVMLSKEKTSSSLRGISVGGFFLILYYLIKNWYKISELHQIIIIGGILGGLVYAGSNQFNIF